MQKIDVIQDNSGIYFSSGASVNLEKNVGMDMMPPMEMFFYSGTDVKFLFKTWTIEDNGGAYFGALLLTFMLGFAIEWLSTRRIKEKYLDCLVYFFKLLMAYTLMLIVMTFNAGLLIAAVFGLTLGYFTFGFRPIIVKRTI